MAVAVADLNSSVSDHVIIAGEADKIVRIHRVMITAANVGEIRLVSAPGTLEAADLTPRLFINTARSLDVNLGDAQALSSIRGAAIGVTSAFSGSEQRHSVLIWYELVD